MPPSDSSYPISVWGKVFEEFRQVKKVRVDWDADRLDIAIEGQKDILQATVEELDDALHKFKGNLREVATYFLREHGILVYYQDTLVGFFDIHAYSSFIDRTPIEKAVVKIRHFFKNAGYHANTDFYSMKLDHWILSDSIILVVDTNRAPLHLHSMQIFMQACSDIMKLGIMNGLPLRGAIGGGDFYKDGELMVSPALVDAALYEKEQEWLGAVFTPTALHTIEKAKDKITDEGKIHIDLNAEHFKAHGVRYGKIPWKPGGKVEKPTDTFYIKPFHMAEKDWASKYLPEYFKDDVKVANSHILYGVDEV